MNTRRYVLPLAALLPVVCQSQSSAQDERQWQNHSAEALRIRLGGAL